jgi:hypothetical protein
MSTFAGVPKSNFVKRKEEKKNKQKSSRKETMELIALRTQHKSVVDPKLKSFIACKTKRGTEFYDGE